jgi:hypothetical protein
MLRSIFVIDIIMSLLLSFWSPTDLTNWECYLEIPAKKYLPYRQPGDVGGLAGYLAGGFIKRCCKYFL